MQRRPEFSFPGSPARRPPPRPPVNAVPPSASEEELRWLQASPDYYRTSSGTPSPPLWRAHPEQQHQFRPYPASAGTSPSRAQAIAGYRREMLDLVRGLPESAYELSLRDIVEHHNLQSSSSSSSPASLPTPPPPPPQSNADVARGREHGNAVAAAAVEEEQSKTKKQGRRAAVRRQRSRSMGRSVSLDTGLLIRFFVPLSIGKKKVSPKPDAAKDANDKKNKKQGTKTKKKKEKEKQDGEFSEASASASVSGSSSRRRSTGSSSNSNGSVGSGGANGGNNSNPRSRKTNGCYAFFRTHKSKNGVSQD